MIGVVMNDTVTKDDLFHAILAMDVYHRGVNSGLKPLDAVTSVGTAKNYGDSLLNALIKLP